MTRIVMVLLLSGLMAGCVSTRARHGYVVELGEDTVRAEIGLDTRESVLARYGEPSVRPALNDNTWYYISMTDNARAFLNADTTSRKITAVHFDVDGVVTEIKDVTLEDGQEIAINERVTPTRGKELTFLQQLMGDVGKIAPTGEGPAGGGPQ